MPRHTLTFGKEMKETTLYPNKAKHFLFLLLSMLFVAGGVWMASDGDWMGHFAYLFFSLCSVVFVIQLIPNSSYLKLRDDEFEFSALFRRHHVKWKDIEGFGIMTQTHKGITTNKMVGWDYKEGFDGSNFGRKASKKIAGIESGLPDTYGMKAEDLLSLMSVYLEHNRTEQGARHNADKSAS